MRWLITGAGGQLGQAFSNFLIKSPDSYKAFSRSQVDVLKTRNLIQLLSKEKPDIVLNCAAWTNVDLAEDNVLDVFEANVLGAYNLAVACLESGVKLIHLSTDYVFSGDQNSPIAEGSRKSPISIYGKSKSIAEDIILELLPETGFIVRTSWLYSRWGNNFAKSILYKLRTQETGSLIHVVSDQIGQPTCATELSHQLHLLGHGNLPAGIYHATNNGAVSWHGFALKIQELSGIIDKNIVGIKSSEWPSKVKRPTFSVLSNSRLEQTGLYCMSNWQQALVNELPHLIQSVNGGR